MKLRLTLAGLIIGVAGFTQKYEFETVIDIDATEIKSQDITGTCWSFSTTSFIESELIRMGKGKHDISEMYTARMVYPEKAANYVRRQGKAQFSEGSLAHDVINTIRKYGMVPESVYSGKPNGEEIHNHSELEAMLGAMLQVVIKSRVLTETWTMAIDAVLNTYLGAAPEKFTYDGKEYTPRSFADEMGINADDYVSLTSFTHHDFDTWFILEVPDNFSNGSFYNIPLDEFEKTVDNALKNGYTIAWDADVSEKTISSKTGMAIWPATPYKELSSEEKEKLFVEILPEAKVDQTTRQKAFENQTTTDDHLMHITGILKDQNGNKYYKVKNSWGEKRGIDGFMYVSQSFFRMKSISVLLHKDALGKDLLKRTGK